VNLVDEQDGLSAELIAPIRRLGSSIPQLAHT
jgi:hypothetical protein